MTGAKWWVVAAALGETSCRIVQGVIAVAWVSRRNSYVDRALLLRSYSAFVVSAVLATLSSFGALKLVGVQTQTSSTLLRFGGASLKLIMVSLVASIVYMVVLRLISPSTSARTITPLLQRLRVPLVLRRILAAPIQPKSTSSTIMD